MTAATRSSERGYSGISLIVDKPQSYSELTIALQPHNSSLHRLRDSTRLNQELVFSVST